MHVVEQATIIEAPIEIVRNAMNDLEGIPRWATVEGTVDNPQGHGIGRSYDWRFQVSRLKFKGKVEVNEAETYREIESPFIVGFKNEKSEDGFFIEFVSERGEVLNKVKGLSAQIDIPAGVRYVRAKITYSRSRSSKSEQFFAWTQPVFLK